MPNHACFIQEAVHPRKLGYATKLLTPLSDGFISPTMPLFFLYFSLFFHIHYPSTFILNNYMEFTSFQGDYDTNELNGTLNIDSPWNVTFASHFSIHLWSFKKEWDYIFHLIDIYIQLYILFSYFLQSNNEFRYVSVSISWEMGILLKETYRKFMDRGDEHREGFVEGLLLICSVVSLSDQAY